jgi:hypothetical protein
MMAALAKAKASALRWCSASPGCARPTRATPAVMPTMPAQAAALGTSPIRLPLPSATSSGAKPRMMG